MIDQDDYESWKDARRQVAVPAGFSERVMSAVRTRDATWRLSLLHSLWIRLSQSRALRISACLLAVAARALRIACVLATFLPLSGFST
jgi:hypothetical protein